MKHVIPSIRILAFLTIMTGVAYPAAVTLVGQALFPGRTNGSLAHSGDVVLGSLLVAQSFSGEKYFWPRPSGGASYNPLPSGGTGLGPTSAALKKAFDDQRTKLMAAHPDMGEPPQDLLFSSGSGLDPEISPEAARYQAVRVAKARGMPTVEVDRMIEEFTQSRQLRFLGEPRVNVLALNIALDEHQGIKIAPSGGNK